MSWTGFLEGAPPAEHAVQCYRHLDELALSVGRFLDAGFRAGEPAVVIACADHWQVFRQEVERDGHNAAELEERGLLTRCDADETLDRMVSVLAAGTGATAVEVRILVGSELRPVAAALKVLTAEQIVQH